MWTPEQYQKAFEDMGLGTEQERHDRCGKFLEWSGASRENKPEFQIHTDSVTTLPEDA